MWRMQDVDQLMRQGVARGVFPGAVLLVHVDSAAIFEQAYGWADLFSRRVMSAETFFDLASLTKPLATSLAVMRLVQQADLTLDQACGQICPELKGTNKALIRVDQLLNHTSGLPAWRPFYLKLRKIFGADRLAALRQMVIDEPLEAPPGAKSEYSDLGYMLLHWLVERLVRQPLEEFVATEIYQPLGIGDLSFNSLSRPIILPQRCAATQLCPWRHRLLVGEVDDDNAWVAGGVAGHAGLFGTAAAVAKLLDALLAASEGNDGQGVFDPDLVRDFFNTGPRQRWALGFDTPSVSGSSAGSLFPAGSIGHLGFTGTSFWVHRQRRIVVVLLTNRVHPFRFHPGIRAFRPLLHDTVMRSVLKFCLNEY